MGDYFEDMKRFQREMNRFFDSFWFPSLPVEGKGFPMLREPLADLKETEKDFVASVELPGVDKKDIQLNITDHNLEIRVEKKDETKIEKKGYVRAERSYKGFYRSISLPSKVLADQAKASCKNGILEVVMPKAEKKKARRLEVE